ncbi:hypothetical protein [Gimesia aquarii]|uniref:Uncharacterized protein n=1 Tax=Gimesia aquarii TaxID=2527964 RepID=A0A517WVU1_9PLAN|nr:hypothetical protein [Gimesia aquarii]QDU09322.1 hypothetical protein V202x_26950 [Gimesia aquarii]
MYRQHPNWWFLILLLLFSSGIGPIRSITARASLENSNASLNRETPNYLANRNFRKGLTKTFSASWSNVEIRSIIQRIRSTQNISIILDRRIDPSLKLKLDIQNLTLEQGLKNLASQAHAKTVLVGSNVYIGPEKAVSNLKTLLEIRKQELVDLTESHPRLKRRFLFLSQRKTFHYQDLDQPSEILEQITDAYQITAKNQDLIPHDLWSHSTFTSVNATEALSLLLIQLNLTYRWNAQETQIELIPIPASVTITKSYTPRAKSVAILINQLKERFPDIEIRRAEKTVSIRTTAEVHEEIEQHLNPKAAINKRKPQSINAVPIQRRKFTLRVKKAPILAIMNKLEASGIEFHYNAKQLQEAGIDLNQLIDISVKDASAGTFFDSLFRTLNVSYAIEGTKIVLTPK